MGAEIMEIMEKFTFSAGSLWDLDSETGEAEEVSWLVERLEGNAEVRLWGSHTVVDFEGSVLFEKVFTYILMRWDQDQKM